MEEEHWPQDKLMLGKKLFTLYGLQTHVFFSTTLMYAHIVQRNTIFKMLQVAHKEEIWSMPFNGSLRKI